MTQKAEHQYQGEFQNAYGAPDNQNKWVWGILAGLAALALVSWLALGGAPSNSVVTSPILNSEQAVPSAPAAPAAESVQPAQPTPGGTTNQQ